MPDALELLLTGDPIDADHARRIGLAWKVHPHDELLAAARTLADRLCQGAPLAVRATNEMATRGRRMPWTDAVRMGETMRRVAATSDDATEGRTAWAENRSPSWRGR
jgi:enoyl-CoA hydratase/carnithine racemase